MFKRTPLWVIFLSLAFSVWCGKLTNFQSISVVIYYCLFSFFKGLQLQPAFAAVDTATAVVTLNSHQRGTSSSSAVLESSSSTAQQQVFSQARFLQLSRSLSECDSAASVGVAGSEQNMVRMGQLVTVGASISGDTGLDGGVHQILLGSGQTIPVQIMETSSPPTVSKFNGFC